MKKDIRKVLNAVVIEISNDAGMALTLSNVGASVMGINYKGKIMDVPLPVSEKIKPNTFFYGKTIGPIAGRIAKGRYKIGEKEYVVPANEGENVVHSSIYDYADKLFDYEVKENEDRLEVIFSLKEEKSQAFPGPMDIKISYVVEANSPIFYWKAHLIAEEKALLSLTNHLYFSLGEADPSALSLKIRSKGTYSYDEKRIPLGKVPLSPKLDFKDAMKIGKHLKEMEQENTKGYDHCFILEEKEAFLQGNGITLHMEFDFPGLQVYYPCIGNLGIALEPSELPDERPLLEEKQAYIREIKYSFS